MARVVLGEASGMVEAVRGRVAEVRFDTAHDAGSARLALTRPDKR
jgi:hypothetical protein